MKVQNCLQHLLPHQKVVGAVFSPCNFIHGVCSRRSEVFIAIATGNYQHVARTWVIQGWASLRRCIFINFNWCEKPDVTCVALWNAWENNYQVSNEFFNFKTLYSPVTTGVLLPMFCARIVNKTPALVPTQIMSLCANSDVTRKQAALCCWMILSQLLSIRLTAGAKFTSQTVFKLKIKVGQLKIEQCKWK